jgi:DNA-binding NarL/FixJ family response regulator
MSARVAKERSPTHYNAPAVSPVTVLVVEDQPATLKSVVKLLNTFSEVRVVATAMTGEAALVEAARARPDVVLMDLELPGMDGIEVTRRLKASLDGIEVLVLTSFEDEDKVFEAVRAGASGYLLKRMPGPRIVEAIREVAAGGTVVEPRLARRFWAYFKGLEPAARAADAAPPPGSAEARAGLSDPELEVLRLVARGLSNAEVGQVLGIERRSVRTHLAHLYAKLGVRSHVAAVVEGLKRGLVTL